MTKKSDHIPGGHGTVKARQIDIHVPVGLRYQTTKLFTDGGFEEVSCERQVINPQKALSQRLGRTMPGADCLTWVSGPEYACEGYSLTFSKVTA